MNDLSLLLSTYGSLGVGLSAWVALAALVGGLAQRRGWNGYLWFGFAILLSPILVGLCLLLIKGQPRPPGYR